MMALAAVALVVVALVVARALTDDSGPPVIALDEEIEEVWIASASGTSMSSPRRPPPRDS